MSARLRAMIVVLMLALALTSCRLFRKPKPAPPPFRLPVQAQPSPARQQPPLVLEDPPPLAPAESPAPIILPPAESQPLPPPSQPQKRPTPAGPPAPQLLPILTPAEKQELERTIARRIGHAQNILAWLEGKGLARQNPGAVSQIRTFIRQAEEARQTDPLRANNLAERAEVLAQDLAERLR